MVDLISYRRFGENFVPHAVTEQRIAAALESLTEGGFEVGPLKPGPLGLAEVAVSGTFGEMRVKRLDGDAVRFQVFVSVTVDARVRLGQTVRLGGDMTVRAELTVRAAEPLRLVIDIEPLTADDLTLRFRFGDQPSRLLSTLSLIDEELRRQVAKVLNDRLNRGSAAEGRIVDVAAVLDGTKPWPIRYEELEWITYGDFGERFLRHAVSTRRIEASVDSLEGRKVEVDPMRAGPREMVEVSADGIVGTPVVTPRAGEPVRFDLYLPVKLDLDIRLTGRDHFYSGTVGVPLRLTARAGEPLLIVIEVDELAADDIEVALRSQGVGAAVLRRIGGLNAQLRQQVAATVNEQIVEGAPGRVVDVGARVDAT